METSEFMLQIVTPDGLLFEGNAGKIILRTTEGDVGILARHIDYVAPLSTGIARVYTSEGIRTAACSGGMVSVSGGKVTVTASTFEWSENIDVERAKKAKEKAGQKLSDAKSEYETRLAEYKLKRALTRINASSNSGGKHFEN